MLPSNFSRLPKNCRSLACKGRDPCSHQYHITAKTASQLYGGFVASGAALHLGSTLLYPEMDVRTLMPFW